MRAKDNPLAKVPYSIARGVRKNTGILWFNVKHASMRLRDVEHVTFKREIYILGPEPVSERLIGQGFYIVGDMRCEIPTIELENAINAVKDDDPKYANPLSSYRELNAVNGGIEAGLDVLETGGVKYRFVQIEGENIWRNVPYAFRCVLRRASAK